jgi:8-oxo-dGTP diphosphatase
VSGTELPKHFVSVAAAVFDDEGRVLVVRRRDNGAWQLPGGVLELDESIHQGVTREVLEETRVLVEPQRLTGVYKNLTIGAVALVFRARMVGGEPGPTEESAQVEWWSLETVRLHMAEVFAVRVRDAVNDSDVAVRLHDGTRLLPSKAASPSANRSG